MSIAAPDAIKAIQKLTAEQAAKWIQVNIGDLTPEAVTQISNWAQGQGFDPGTQARKSQVLAAIQSTEHFVDVNKTPGHLDKAAQEQVSKAVSGQPATSDLDGDGTVSAKEQKAVAKAQTTVAAKTGASVSQIDKTTTQAGLAPLTPTPRWVLDSFSNSPGFAGDLSQLQKNRIVDQWNTVYGTAFDWKNLIVQPGFKDPTSVTTGIVQAAIQGDEPTVAYTVKLPNNRTVTIDEATHKAQIQGSGLTTQQAVRAIQYADTFGMTSPTGATDWQPVAALMKATGKLPQVDEKLKKLEQAVSDLNEIGPSKQLSEAKAALAAYKATKKPEDSAPLISGPLAALIPGGNTLIPGAGVAKLTTAFKQGMDKYGEPTMAYLSALDPALASRLFATNGDITKVNQQDMLRASQLMGAGGWDPSVLAAQGYYGASKLDDFLGNLSARTKALQAQAQGTLPPVRTYTDPEAVKQTAKDLWRALFRDDPSDATTAQIAAEIRTMESRRSIADQSTGTNGQDLDINARIRQILEGTGTYKTLYSHKQDGVTEQDYQNQFVGAQGQMLGSQVDNGAIVEGMKTGDIGTTIGQSAATGISTENSTFLGRLAQAAQVIGAMT